jgi:hypothetical protein
MLIDIVWDLKPWRGEYMTLPGQNIAIFLITRSLLKVYKMNV